jgi:hypothetical protein
MANKAFLYGPIIAIVGALSLPQALAQDVVEFEMEATTNSMMPILIGNDPNLIAGFQYESDAIFNGGKIGTFSLQVLLTDPPLDLAVPISEATMEGTFTMAVGTCQVSGYGVGLVNSETPVTGEVRYSNVFWMDQCTDQLTDVNVIATGDYRTNLFTGVSEGSEVWTVQIGF